MKAFSALISVSDQTFGTTYIHLTIGGQPHAISSTLTNALSGARAITMHSRRLALLIIGAIPHKRLRSASLFTDNEPDLAHAKPVDYRYEIDLPPLAARRILVTEISDGGSEDKYFEGLLDNFINYQFRRLKKPRGRTPNGFTRAEWEEHHNAPRTDAPDFVQSRLRNDVLRERAQAENPHVNLSGVRVFSKDESLARSRERRNSLREKHKRLGVKK